MQSCPMPETVAVSFVGPEDLALRRELEAFFHTPRTLDEVLRWTLACSPPRELLTVVPQDEYTNDLVFSWDARFLVLAST